MVRKINVIKEIKRVLSVQSLSIRQVQKHIGKPFRLAVEIIYDCHGKVVVTGIGKSGLVAQKIASTFSSTGTPAIYLNPVEGMHGNLGVVHKNDVVLAIGKSGESEELLNIVPSLRKIGARIIALTSNAQSSLASLSNLVLHVPVEREACPLNLAPTTSSTVALAVGDGLAIALMKMRGFGAETFALYHPGGTLGKRLLLKVSDIMRGGRRNPVVSIHASMDRLLVEISQKWTGAASVINGKRRLLGLVTDFDIRNAFAQGKIISNLKIPDIMNPRPTFIFLDETAAKALQIMESRKKPLTVLPVVDRKKRSVGMIHVHDLISKGLIQPQADLN